MSEARKPLYYNTLSGEFQQFDASLGDVLKVVLGTDVIAGEAFQPNDLLYIKASDAKAYKAKADDDAKKSVVLVAAESGPVIDDVYSAVLPGNEIPDTGLTQGSKYWLDKTTAGAKTATPPIDNWVVEAGTATSATTFLFNPRTRVKLS